MAQRVNPSLGPNAKINERLPGTLMARTILIGGLLCAASLENSLKFFDISNLEIKFVTNKIIIASMLLIPWSVSLLARAFEQMVTGWETTRSKLLAPLEEKNSTIYLVTLYPFGWLLFGPAYFLLTSIAPNTSSYYFESTFKGDPFLIIIPSVSLAIIMSQFLKRLHQWRLALHGVQTKLSSKVRTKCSAPKLFNWWYFGFIYPIVLAGVILFLTVIEIWLFNGSSDLGFPGSHDFLYIFWLFTGAIYPYIWLAFIAREFMLVNQTAANFIDSGADIFQQNYKGK